MANKDLAGQSQPLLSIVVAAHNAQDTIERCLGSVVDQHDANVELVVVDDGSTDDTGDLADACAREHDNVRVIHQPNAGANAARMVGIEACSGSWLLLLDADDWHDPQALSTLRAHMHEPYDVICFPVRKVYDDGRVLEEPARSEKTNARGMAELILEPEGPYQGYMTNKCVRMEAVRQAGGLDTHYRYCEDEEWWLRVAATLERERGANTCVRILEDFLYNYLQAKTGMRRSSLLDVDKSARDAIVALVENTWPDLAYLAYERHALWQNRVVVAALKARSRSKRDVLARVVVPAYRKELYRHNDVRQRTKVKTAVLGVVGDFCAARGRRHGQSR